MKTESKNVTYYKSYLQGLKDFFRLEGRSLKTGEYYLLEREIIRITKHIERIR